MGTGLLVWNLLKWFSGAETWDTEFVLVGIGLLGIGFFILHMTPETITLINKKLKVVTVITRGLITSSYTQYSFDEISGPMSVEELGWFKGLFPLYSIRLPVKDLLDLRLSGRTHFFPDIYSEIVTDANSYLRPALSAPKTDSAGSSPS